MRLRARERDGRPKRTCDSKEGAIALREQRRRERPKGRREREGMYSLSDMRVGSCESTVPDPGPYLMSPLFQPG